jgi:hypothetical protein
MFINTTVRNCHLAKSQLILRQTKEFSWLVLRFAVTERLEERTRVSHGVRFVIPVCRFICAKIRLAFLPLSSNVQETLPCKN